MTGYLDKRVREGYFTLKSACSQEGLLRRSYMLAQAEAGSMFRGLEEEEKLNQSFVNMKFI